MFFFFQAEDGIRDYKVTGVQTCALPIYWYDLGLELEVAAPAEARDAYRRALELDPHHADAHVNLGRLLHEQRLVGEAERHYRLALRENPQPATAAVNLAIALEDLGRPPAALD